MKKSNLTVDIVYMLIGIGCLLAAMFTNNKLNDLLLGFAGAELVFGSIMVFKYIYWNSPDNSGRYKEKIEAENIERRDELKDKVRCKAAQYVYILSLAVISASTVVFSVLNSFDILENGNVFVCYLTMYMVFQIISGHLFFKHILKKYE